MLRARARSQDIPGSYRASTPSGRTTSCPRGSRWVAADLGESHVARRAKCSLGWRYSAFLPVPSAMPTPLEPLPRTTSAHMSGYRRPRKQGGGQAALAPPHELAFGSKALRGAARTRGPVRCRNTQLRRHAQRLRPCQRVSGREAWWSLHRPRTRVAPGRKWSATGATHESARLPMTATGMPLIMLAVLAAGCATAVVPTPSPSGSVTSSSPATTPTATPSALAGCPTLEPASLPPDLTSREVRESDGLRVVIWSGSGDANRTAYILTGGGGEAEGGAPAGELVTLLGSSVDVYADENDVLYAALDYSAQSGGTCDWVAVGSTGLSLEEFRQVAESVAER